MKKGRAQMRSTLTVRVWSHKGNGFLEGNQFLAVHGQSPVQITGGLYRFLGGSGTYRIRRTPRGAYHVVRQRFAGSCFGALLSSQRDGEGALCPDGYRDLTGWPFGTRFSITKVKR